VKNCYRQLKKDKKTVLFQDAQNPDIANYFCWNALGIVLLIGYIVFCYLITHKGNFYQIRRWKASFWLATIFNIGILSVMFAVFKPLANNSSLNIFQVVGSILEFLLSTLTINIPFTFMATIGTQHQLKWWMNSDDYLDKVWKDPNKRHKSPIQDL
jgi:hypothetical protein